MSNIPTTSEIYSNILADLESKYPGLSIPLVGKNFLRALAGVQAGVIRTAYLYLGRVQKNLFVDTADPESIGGTLERFGRVKLGRGPFPATVGEYLATVQGAIGATIGAQTTFKSNDDSLNPGVLFILDSDFTFVSASGQITLRALEAGLSSQLLVGDELTVTAPIALVDAVATIDAETVEPQAAEDLEEYREKAIEAYRLEPQGGAGADYRLWSADAQGVAQSYPYASSGASNEIDLFIEATLIDSTDGKGTPTVAILDAVKASIEEPTLERPSRKPLGVYQVNYLPVNIREIDLEIPSFVGLTPAIETQIFNAIKLELSTIRPFVSSIDVVANRNDIFDVNIISATILNAVPGSSFGAPLLKVDSVNLSTFTFENGDIPNLNSITYV